MLCSYPRCQDYADAIATGEAEINQCPPGGDVTISALAKLLDRPPLPLNESHGRHEKKHLAIIREADCIGCRLCLKACPVDCIVGAAKVMHTVISAQCTGCKLCIPVCPTDCIDMVPAQKFSAADSPWCDFTAAQVDRARRDTALKLYRIDQCEQARHHRKQQVMRQQLKQDIAAAVQRKKNHAVQEKQ